jgi:ribosome-binding protein aMBF1 (putative translation factor)
MDGTSPSRRDQGEGDVSETPEEPQPAKRMRPERAAHHLQAVAYLKAWRTARGWSIRQLATLSGVPHPAIVQMEHGQRKASAGSVDKLARALRISKKRLLNEAPPEGDQP